MAGQCNAITQQGGRCRYPADRCPWHSPGRRPRDGSPTQEQRRLPLAMPPRAAAERDLRELGWWLIGEVLGGGIEQRDAAVVATLIRTLASLGPSPLEEQQALLEVALRGRLMHGLPPAGADEWKRAEAAFEPAAILEFRRWRALLEGDAEDGHQPLFLGEVGGEELDAFIPEGQDGA